MRQDKIIVNLLRTIEVFDPKEFKLRELYDILKGGLSNSNCLTMKFVSYRTGTYSTYTGSNSGKKISTDHKTIDASFLEKIYRTNNFSFGQKLNRYIKNSIENGTISDVVSKICGILMNKELRYFIMKKKCQFYIL